MIKSDIELIISNCMIDWLIDWLKYVVMYTGLGGRVVSWPGTCCMACLVHRSDVLIRSEDALRLSAPWCTWKQNRSVGCFYQVPNNQSPHSVGSLFSAFCSWFLVFVVLFCLVFSYSIYISLGDWLGNVLIGIFFFFFFNYFHFLFFFLSYTFLFLLLAIFYLFLFVFIF